MKILHRNGRFELSLRIAPDSERDALLIDIELTCEPDLSPYALLAPHLGGTGRENYAEVFSSRGEIVLCAEQVSFALALAAADPLQTDAWQATSAGYVGVSDGWQAFDRNGHMSWFHEGPDPATLR